MEEEKEISEKKVPLTMEEAQIRKSLVVKEDGSYTMDYKLFLTTRRTKDSIEKEDGNFEGHLNCNFSYYPKGEVKPNSLFLNFVGVVYALKINGQKIEKFIYENNRLILDPKLLKEKENNVLDITFCGKYNHNGVGLHQYTDPADQKEYLYTQFEPYDCNRLFPCFDQPSIKGTLDLTVIAPEEWIVLSNGIEDDSLCEPINEGFNFEEKLKLEKEIINVLAEKYKIKEKKYKYHKFKQTPKISSYLYALCAGPYYCINCPFDNAPVPMHIYMRESLKDFGEPNEIFRVTIAGMNWYKDYFGIPFQFAKYDHIFCPEYNMGAMENVGLITLNEFYCWKSKPTRRRRDNFTNTVLHELAHMWFGDLVTMEWWDDLWLNESFATFISHLCMFRSEDLKEYRDTAWVIFGEGKGYAYNADQAPTTHPIMSKVIDTEVAESDFDSIVYEKGSSFLKQFYYYIGDETFSKGLKIYFEKYKWQNTVFDQFIDKMVEASGDKLTGLKDFCKQWLQKEGLCEISLDLEIDESTQKITKFVVKQKPCLEDHPNIQKHIVDFLFIYDFEHLEKNKEFKRMVIEAQPETTFDFSSELPPLAVFLNYNDWGYMKLNLDLRSFENIKKNVKYLKDPLTKQSILRSLFDECRDAVIPSAEYLEFLMEAVHYEDDQFCLASMLRNMNAAFYSYIPIEFNKLCREKVFAILVDLLIKELNKKEKISEDIFKQILFYLPITCTNDEDLKILIDLMGEKPLLKGIEVPPNLISQENRFSFLNSIFKSRTIPQAKKDEYLEEEIKKDKNSSDSTLARYSCKALIPTKENKEKIWNEIVNHDKDAALVNLEEYMTSFAPLDQLDLVEDFLKVKFFEVLPTIGTKNENTFVEYFVSSCSPSCYVTEEIIKKYEETLEKLKDQKQVLRYAQEDVDIMKRKMKTHKLCYEYLKNKKFFAGVKIYD